MKAKATKDKILEAANNLFAEKGYSGTSIRDIAKYADVNLSAVNYHFTNKDNLYAEVFQMNHKWMEESISQIGEDDSLNMQEFTWKVFQFFSENGAPLLNTFKIFLNEKLANIPDDIFNDCKGNMGPPGHETFFKIIRKDVGQEISYEAVHWAMETIFTDVVHSSICMNAPMLKEKLKDIPQFSPEAKKIGIYCLVDAVLNYIKDNPDAKFMLPSS